MIQCRNCGWDNFTSATICEKCGYNLKSPTNLDIGTSKDKMSAPQEEKLESNLKSFTQDWESKKDKNVRIYHSSKTILANRFDINLGDIIDDYQVEKVISEGLSSDVFKVREIYTNEVCAIKILKLYDNPPNLRKEINSRFNREFECGAIDSMYILQSIRQGDLNGNPYILQEYADGGSVAQYIKPDLSFNFIKSFAIEVLKGLEILHNNGIIHRDIKPNNIFIKNGKFKIGDFGATGYQNSRITRVNLLGHAKGIFGTYAYLAPEQGNSTVSFKTMRPITDLWSFGVTLFEIITGGKLPFGDLNNDADLANYLTNALKGNCRTVNYYRADAPEYWSEIINACIEPDYKKRINSAGELLKLIESKSNTGTGIKKSNLTALKYKYDIFLSFASEDEEFAEKVYESLSFKGLKVFFAKESRKNYLGQSFFQMINDALEQCQHFILICSEVALKKEWVKAEYETFFNECHVPNSANRRLIPLPHPEYSFEKLPFLLRRFQIARTPEEVMKNLIPKYYKTIPIGKD